ncbi:hypothetical protein ACSZNH_17920 [Aeromonas dhakensis]|uniref:hypothetical protein n=1 Tax=Aeromonas dhakensis TaxID=196024 RepID=UPI00227BEA5C|nr:hypothetical protein [Aeromonas dhakensis]WAF74644.1 hypothetical protein NRK99_10340 [Aeromonas dhakensis]
MDFNLPPGLFGLIKGWLEKKIFLRAYIVSHDRYICRTSKLHFKRLVSAIDYDVKLASRYISNTEVPMSKLYVKTQGGNVYNRFSGYVKAFSGRVCYQNYIDIELIFDEQITIVHLPSIPLKNITFDEDGIYSTYSDVTLSGVLYGEGGVTEKVSSIIGSPTYTEFLNSTWVRKWDHVWNLDFLELEFGEMKHSLIYKLAGPFALLACSNTYVGFFGAIKKQWDKFIINIIANEKVLKVYWWITMPIRVRRWQKSKTFKCDS